ncbi:MAG: branched-chain amino acid transporter permease [Enterococcus hulanensis]
MSLTEQIVTIFIVSAATFFTRFLPFVIFSNSNETPHFILELGEFLPSAIIAMLVIYCFRDITFATFLDNWPYFLASVITVAIHIWKRNMLMSILFGTAVYIVIVNFL